MSSDQSRKRMVKLCQCLDMNRKTGAPVMGDWVQDKPGQRIVALQNISEYQVMFSISYKLYLKTLLLIFIQILRIS